MRKDVLNFEELIMNKKEKLLCGVTQDVSNKFANMGFICSCFVVYIHTFTECTPGDSTWWMMSMIRDGLSRIAVPFFFITSGFFLAGHCNEFNWWRLEVMKRLRTLLVPYLSWSTINFVFKAILVLIANAMAGVEWTRNMPSTLIKWLNVYGLTFEALPLMKVLWFVRWLFLMVLLSPIFIRILRFKYVSVLYLIFLFIIWFIVEPIIFDLPYWQSISLLGLFFFNVGLYLRLSGVSLGNRCAPKVFAVISFLLGIVFFAMKNYYEIPHYDALGGVHYQSRFYMPAIVFTLIGVWLFIPTRKWSKILTSNSFPIYLIHCFFLILLELFRKYFPTFPYPSGIFRYLLNGALAIGVSILAAHLLRKFLPRVSTVLFGGR